MRAIQTCGAISVQAEFMVKIQSPGMRAAQQPREGCTMLLGLKPGHSRAVISVAAEFMVDVAWIAARPFV
jgi:hypothetical protein